MFVRVSSIFKQFCLFFHIAGGLFCFTMRNHDATQYEDKILELEKKGSWHAISKEKMPYFDCDALPKEVNGFIYKVSHN